MAVTITHCISRNQGDPKHSGLCRGRGFSPPSWACRWQPALPVQLPLSSIPGFVAFLEGCISGHVYCFCPSAVFISLVILSKSFSQVWHQCKGAYACPMDGHTVPERAMSYFMAFVSLLLITLWIVLICVKPRSPISLQTDETLIACGHSSFVFGYHFLAGPIRWFTPIPFRPCSPSH